MRLSKRDLMLLMNGIALTADTLAVQTEGRFPDCQSFDSIKASMEFATKEYGQNAAIYFHELNDLFTRLLNETKTDEITGEEVDLLHLPPNEFIH